MDPLVVASSSAAETQALAARLSELAESGDLVILVGDLGAGKTAFVQGFGRGLGVEEPITSPTFTLANVYHGRFEVNHLDAYRLDQLEEVTDLALPELLDGDTVTLIEWGDAILPALPATYLEVRLTLGEGDDDREIRLVGAGGWTARDRAMREIVTAWEAEGRC